MLYGYYEYLSNGKPVFILFEFDSDNVTRVSEEDLYSFDVQTSKILFSHNVDFKAPPKLNMTYGQLHGWSSENLNDVVKRAIIQIFKEFTSKRL